MTIAEPDSGCVAGYVATVLIRNATLRARPGR
jgi:hypothetical protein